MAVANDNGRAESTMIADEAASWCVKLGDAAITDAQRRTFVAWLRQSPDHAAAFEDVAEVWAGLNALPRAAFDPMPMNNARRWGPTRRQWLAGAVTAGAAAAFGAWTLMPSTDISAAFRTPKSIPLAPGAALDLDSLSVIGLAAGEPHPHLRLRHGQIFVQTARPAGKGISVAVPFGTVQAETATFNLKIERRRALLSVQSGQVIVERQMGGRMTLGALAELPFGAEVVDPVRKISPSLVAPWRDGRLVFDRTLLADAIDDINRYRPGRVLIGDPRLDDRLVTGHFDLTEADAALAALMSAFSLKSLNFGTSLRVLFAA
jgi:transmembrane sensor